MIDKLEDFIQRMIDHCSVSGRNLQYENRALTKQDFINMCIAATGDPRVNAAAAYEDVKADINLRQQQADMSGRQKKSVSESRPYVLQMDQEISKLLLPVFCMAPISRQASVYAIYELVRFADGESPTTVKICEFNNDETNLTRDLVRVLAKRGLDEIFEDLWERYYDAIPNFAGRFGNDWKKLVLRGMNEMVSGNRKYAGNVYEEPIDPIKNEGKEEGGKMFHPAAFRMPPITTDHCNDWNYILERCSDPLLFCVWFSRLFTPGDQGRQALVLQGSGVTGSSTLVSALERVLGGSLIKRIPKDTNNFSAPMQVGALLRVAPDESDKRFLLSDKFKNYTGGDFVYGELKHGKALDVFVYSKVLVYTNTIMIINPLQLWSTSRVIYLELEKVDDRFIEPEYDVSLRLAEQLPFFISKCKIVDEEYTQRKAVNKVTIPITRTTELIMRKAWPTAQADAMRWIQVCISNSRIAPETVVYTDGPEAGTPKLNARGSTVLAPFLYRDEVKKKAQELIFGKNITVAAGSREEDRVSSLTDQMVDYIRRFHKIPIACHEHRDGTFHTGFPGLVVDNDAKGSVAVEGTVINFDRIDGLYLGEKYTRGGCKKAETNRRKALAKRVEGQERETEVEVEEPTPCNIFLGQVSFDTPDAALGDIECLL